MCFHIQNNNAQKSRFLKICQLPTLIVALGYLIFSLRSLHLYEKLNFLSFGRRGWARKGDFTHLVILYQKNSDVAHLIRVIASTDFNDQQLIDLA